MPYPRAHYWVAFVMAVIALGFWPSYFAVWTDVPWQFHAHGIAASLWVMMVFGQSWTAHHGQLWLHRAVGKSSLLLFPFLIGGLAAIIDVTAKGYLAGDPFRSLFAGPFLTGLVLAIAAYVTVYYRALKYRRKVWIHSGYMLTTPLILFESPFGRILNGFVPELAIRGPEDFHLVMHGIQWSLAIELAFVAAVWLRFGKKATPFLFAGAFIAAQMLFMGPLGHFEIFRTALATLGTMPSLAVVLAGFAIGALTSWAGWQAGRRRSTPIAGAAQAA